MLKKLLIMSSVALFSINSFATEEKVVADSDSSTAIAESEPDKAEMMAADILAITDFDIVLGDADAPVTIVEYASMTCNHCAYFHNKIFEDLKMKYVDTGKVKFVFRDFPLEKVAFTGSVLARCAAKDGEENFLRYLKTMFSTQQNWSGKKNYVEVLANIAKLGGMSAEEFEACMADKDLETKILEGKFNAQKYLEVRSTPTFFINGQMHRGVKDMTYLSQAIDGIINGANASILVEGEEEAEVAE